MKILLINPPYEAFLGNPQGYFPLGLTYLAAAIKKYTADEAVVYDCDYDYGEIEHAPNDIETINHYDDYYLGVKDENSPVWQKIKKNILEIKPDVVGITSYSSKLPATKYLTRWLEKQGIKVYVGGPHETTYGTGAGIPFKGEGEVEFIKLLHPELKDLSFNPLDLMPDRSSLWQIEKYRPSDLGIVMGERGCPFNCYFCQTRAIWGQQIRHRPIDDVIAEIKFVNQKFGTKKFYLCDDTFTYDLNRVKNFVDKMPLELEWTCLTRPSTIKTELLEVLKKSNCVRVKLGIETCSPKMLKLIGKTETIYTYFKAAMLLKKYKIDWTAYIMLALPNETELDWQTTQKSLEQLQPRWISAGIFTIFPATELAKNFKIDFSKYDFSKYGHQSPYAWSGLSKEKIIARINWVDEYNKINGGNNPYREKKE